MNFDCYFDGNFRSSYATSNFQIYKINDTLSINYAPGATPGSFTAVNTHHALTVDTTGMVTIPNTLSAGIVYVNSTTASSNGSGKLQILGSSGVTVNSPSILCNCTTDVYPLLNIMPFSHDAVEILFDAWRMPSNQWQSGSANSNFRLSKGSTTFTLNYSSGNALGANIGWGNGWTVNTSGQLSIGNNVINTGMQKLMIYGPNNSVNGPHIQTFTSSDNFPLLQVMSLQHNNVTLGFDTYYDGSGYLSSLR